jgi:hypothetical protein
MAYIWIMNSDCFPQISERPITAKDFTWMRASNCHWSVHNPLLSLWARGLLGVRRLPPRPKVNYEYIMLCPCIWGISQLDCSFLSRLLTGYSKLKDIWSNDLPSLSEAFLNGTLFWGLWHTARKRELGATFSSHSDVHGWLRTASNRWLAIVLPHK